MTNYKYIEDELLTDEAVIGALGQKTKQARLKINMTQTELANQCGVAKRTIERFEHGASIQLTSFVRIIRALSHIENLLAVIPEQVQSPMAMLLREDETRYRATGSRKTKGDDANGKNKPWEWAE